MSIAPETDGPRNAPAPEEEQHARQPEEVGDDLGGEPGAEHEGEREDHVAGRSSERIRPHVGAVGRRTVGVATRPRWRTIPLRVLIVILLENAPGAPLLLLTLAIALYLTVIEFRELRPHWKWWAWWISLVFLTHFVGYLALRIYVALQSTKPRAALRDRPLGQGRDPRGRPARGVPRLAQLRRDETPT